MFGSILLEGESNRGTVRRGLLSGELCVCVEAGNYSVHERPCSHMVIRGLFA